ncbi:tetratricopeptide repeat protein [Candidatus Peregrinibacteria bacterium]|nr:tetratricopeptide repeat protein [Candidatus Peregrinibacteria bacterium]
MKRLPPRILSPILAAVCCVVVLLGFLWWELSSTRSDLGRQLRNVTDRLRPGSQTGSTLPADDFLDATGDESLLHLRTGDLLALQGEWASAAGEYQKAVDTGGGLTALRKLAQAQLQIRDIPAARNTLEKLRRAGARSEDLLLIESIILLRSADLVKASQLLQSATPSPQQHYGLALLAIVQGNTDEAKSQLRQVIEGWEPVLRTYARTLLSAYDEYALFPVSPPSHLQTLVAHALAQVQECELALPILSRVTTVQDDYRDAWIIQGYCELTTNRAREAVASFERAYALDPEKPEIQYFLGRSYAALGDSQNAMTFLKYAIQNRFEPESDARRLLAKVALKANDAVTAMEQEQTLTTLPDANLDTYREFISVALQLGKKQEAYLKAVEATQKWPDDARSFELLGDTAVTVDQKEEAKKAYQTALQKNPNANSVQEKLKKL